MHDKIRVPLVDVIFREPYEITLSFTVNNTLGIKNSKLIETYCLFDNRCRVMALLIKIWSKVQNVHGADRGYPSSYAYNLLVINYLQTIPRPILPSLQQISKEEDREILLVKRNVRERSEEFETLVNFESSPEVLEKLKAEKYSSNKSDIAVLLCGFFEFYSQQRDLKYDIKNAARIPKTSEDDDLNLVFSLVDPFDSRHNPGMHLKKLSMEANHVKRMMEKSIEMINKNRLSEIFEKPLDNNKS
jgi:DNA polymerase sigma